MRPQIGPGDRAKVRCERAKTTVSAGSQRATVVRSKFVGRPVVSALLHSYEVCRLLVRSFAQLSVAQRNVRYRSRD